MAGALAGRGSRGKRAAAQRLCTCAPRDTSGGHHAGVAAPPLRHRPLRHPSGKCEHCPSAGQLSILLHSGMPLLNYTAGLVVPFLHQYPVVGHAGGLKHCSLDKYTHQPETSFMKCTAGTGELYRPRPAQKYGILCISDEPGLAMVNAWVQGNLSSVMEYVPGGSLRSGLQKLQRSTGATNRLRACIALQAARGEITLHPRWQLRRDIPWQLHCQSSC